MLEENKTIMTSETKTCISLHIQEMNYLKNPLSINYPLRSNELDEIKLHQNKTTFSNALKHNSLKL